MSAPDVSPPEQLAQLVGVRSELATALATALHEARSNPTGYPLRQAIEGALTELAALQKLAKSWRVESAPPAGPSPRDLLALAVVRWDGGGEDGCAFCGGEWAGGDAPGVDPFVLHESACIVVTHRLALIERLMDGDPAPDTEDGKLLVELATAQERYEKASSSEPEGNR